MQLKSAASLIQKIKTIELKERVCVFRSNGTYAWLSPDEVADSDRVLSRAKSYQLKEPVCPNA